MPFLGSPGTFGFATPPAGRHAPDRIAVLRRRRGSRRPGSTMPSEPVGASQIVCGGPPAMSTFLQLAGPPMNAIVRLSGAQNGARARRRCPAATAARATSSARTQICRLPSASVAMNTMLRPSGETSGDVGFVEALGQSAARSRTTGGGSGARRTHATAKPSRRERRQRARAPTRCRSRVLRFTVTTAGRPTFDPPCDDPAQLRGDVAGRLPAILRILREAPRDDPLERRRRQRHQLARSASASSPAPTP